MTAAASTRVLAALVLALAAPIAAAQEAADDEAALARKLANPIASLISVPIQFNYDGGYGPLDGERAFVNIQPVIPFDLTDDLSLVTRTIVPVVWQDDIAGASGVQFGLGDTVQSFFFVPNSAETSLGTLTWGAGPVVQWPTSTDRLLGSGTLGLGPTAVALVQNRGWTWGALVNHVWGVADTRSAAPTLNVSFVQPFLSYTTPDAWTFTLNSESSYDWTREDGAIPINAMVAKMVDFDGQKVQFQLGARYWARSTRNGADGWGARAAVILLFPR
jgi:hypothetical protein